MPTALAYLWGAVRFAWCVMQVFSFAMVYLVYLALLWPLKFVWPRLFWFLEGKLYRWMQAQVGYWGITGGYTLTEYGDELDVWDDRCLVMCNHQTTADVPCISALLQDKGKAANKVCWIIDAGFKWTPFGMCGRIHGDCFITQGRAVRDKLTASLAEKLQRVFWERDRRWIIVFPEGNFLYKQKASNRRWAEKNGHPLTDYVLLPRYGVVKIALDRMGPEERSRSATDAAAEAQASVADDVATQATVSAVMEASGSEAALPVASSAAAVTVVGSEEAGTPASDSLNVPDADGLRRRGTQETQSSSEETGEGMRRVGSSKELFLDTLSAIRSKGYLRETKPRIKYVVDVTLAYADPDKAPGMASLMLGLEPQDVKVFYRKIPLEQIPYEAGDDALRDWLYDVWIKKENLLKEFYTTGSSSLLSSEVCKKYPLSWLEPAPVPLLYLLI